MAALPLSQVQSANQKAKDELPPGLVAVFAGATAGIGALALKGFAKSTVKPRVYFIGRSEEGAAQLKAELNEINEGGEYTFVKADMSSLKKTDKVCREIMAKEQHINVLFMSQETLRFGSGTLLRLVS